MDDYFSYIWELLERHGVVPSEKEQAHRLWNTFTHPQKQYIYRAIRDKIRAGKFVNYHPHIAIRDNAPKPPKYKIISADEYYSHYKTQVNQDGWRRVFLKDKQQTIYVKQI